MNASAMRHIIAKIHRAMRVIQLRGQAIHQTGLNIPALQK